MSLYPANISLFKVNNRNTRKKRDVIVVDIVLVFDIVDLVLVFLLLRYYATIEVRKSESPFYKINTCLQKTTTCMGLQAEEKFSVNI